MKALLASLFWAATAPSGPRSMSQGEKSKEFMASCTRVPTAKLPAPPPPTRKVYWSV